MIQFIIPAVFTAILALSANAQQIDIFDSKLNSEESVIRVEDKDVEVMYFSVDKKDLEDRQKREDIINKIVEVAEQRRGNVASDKNH